MRIEMNGNKGGRTLWVWLIALFVAGLAGYSVGVRAPSTPLLESVAHADKTSSESGLLKRSSESFRAVVRKVGPAVVTIKSTQGAPPRRHGRFRGHPMQPPQDEGDDQGQGPGMGEDPFFDFFRRFGGPFQFPEPQQQGPATSLGSGVIIDPRGYIVTNNHVVQGASKVVVNLPSQETVELPAKVIGTDPRSDLAVLKIEKKDLPYAKWADSDSVEVGDWAIAIGSPFMLSHTVTAGIVSAKGRNSSVLGSQYGYDMLQTDAAINPGNSGGPLCTIDGEVMGVNTAIYTRSGGYMGIGFAIPSNLAKNIVDTLIQGKKVVRGWLGVTIQPIDEATAHDLGITSGALVHSVEPESPAAKAGLHPGDVILDIGGKPVKDTAQVQQTVSANKPGSKVAIKVINYNDKKTRTVSVTIGELPANLGTGEEERGGGRSSTPDPLGVSVSKASGGVRIDAVEPGSLADQVGLQKGDKIVSVNRKPTHTVEAYEKAIKGTKSLNILVNRQGQEIFLQLTLP